MQHSYISELVSEGHPVLWRALKYTSLAVVALFAVTELSTGMLITLLMAAGLVFALAERVRKIDELQPGQSLPVRLLGDGGSFPNDLPEMERGCTEPARVLDGGSLERHRI